MLRFFLHAEVIINDGKLLPTPRPLIIVMNHTTRLDPFLTALLPRPFVKDLVPFAFLTAEKYYKKWWMKPVIAAMGSIPVKQIAWSMDEYLEGAARKLDEGHALVLFPEGQVVREGNKSAKPGLGYLVHSKKASILPIYLEGIQGLTYMDFFLRRRQLKMFIGSMIVERVDSQELKEQVKFSENVMRKVRSIKK